MLYFAFPGQKNAKSWNIAPKYHKEKIYATTRLILGLYGAIYLVQLKSIYNIILDILKYIIFWRYVLILK